MHRAALVLVSCILFFAKTSQGEAQQPFTAEVVPASFDEQFAGFVVRIQSSQPMFYIIGLAFRAANEGQEKLLNGPLWTIVASGPEGTQPQYQPAPNGLTLVHRTESGAIERWGGGAHIIVSRASGETEVKFGLKRDAIQRLRESGINAAIMSIQGGSVAGLALRTQEASFLLTYGISLESIPALKKGL